MKVAHRKTVGLLEPGSFGETGEEHLWFYCPGCQFAHAYRIAGTPDKPRPVWQWNGDLERPTLSPSLMNEGQLTCHLFLTDGLLQFLPDCTHKLAGQTVPIPDLPEWLR